MKKRRRCEWKKATKDFTDFGALPKAELEIAYLANLFFIWVEEVRAEILEVDKLKVSNIHIQFYGWEDGAEPFTGTMHADLRLEAVMPGDLARVLLPAADCYDRPLLFVIANGVLRQGGSVFSFAWTHARVVGVAFGAIVMNAVGCGALELLPAGEADLSGSGDDGNRRGPRPPRRAHGRPGFGARARHQQAICDRRDDGPRGPRRVRHNRRYLSELLQDYCLRLLVC